MIEITAVPGKVLMLGRQGENLARKVIFSVSGVRAEFGDGAFRLSARRAGESNVYPAAVTENGDTVEWSLTSADTQNAGRGSCELAYYAGDVRLKTWVYDTAVAKSLTGSPETDPYDEFLDEVNRLAAEAAISQREAKNSENAAKNSEENAKTSENAAKTSEDNAAEYARAALAAETKSEQNAGYATSAATAAGQYAQNAATSATNAASSASAAETHEKGAKDAAAAAAKSAEGLADAVKRAEDAAASAQDNAGKTAADREAVAGMKTAAETAQGNAEKAATAAAGSATSAGESAVAAETSRAGAAEIKTQIDDIKAGIDTTKGEIDQAKADIDQTKIDTLAAKIAAETAAATATEKAAEIADSAAQIAKNTENIGKSATDIDLLRRENVELKAKTDALWKLSEGKSYDFFEDSAEAYSKDVPTGCKFAQIEKIGGKTGAWNQWVDETKYTDATSASVTTTVSGRRIVIVGTSGSTGENFSIIGMNTEIWSAVANHYYLLAGISKLTGLDIGAYNGAKVITIALAGSTAKNAVFKPAFSGTSQLYFNTAKAGVAVDVDCTPYLIDLTQLYGSGNEPTTADDPRITEIIAYAEKHLAYNTGELVSAGVEDVEVQGVNLLDPKKTTAYGDKPYGLTITMIGENTFRISGVPSSQVTSAGDYSFSVANNSQEELRGKGYKVTAFPIKGTVNSAWGLEPVNKGKLAISAPLVPEVDTDIEFRLMVSTATPSAYSPYSLDIYPIPDAVKALPGYGWSAGNISNEIVRRADGWDYVQRVERHIADNPDKWRLINNNIRKVFVTSTEKPALKLAGSNNFRMVCDRLMYVDYSYAIESKQPYTISFQSNATTLAAVFTDTDTDSLDTWQAWLQSLIDAGTPLTVYYAVATPITTDITNLMTGALPLVTTEPGGTITMHHALADDGLMLDVPNTIKYIRDLKEVASSGTE